MRTHIDSDANTAHVKTFLCYINCSFRKQHFQSLSYVRIKQNRKRFFLSFIFQVTFLFFLYIVTSLSVKSRWSLKVVKTFKRTRNCSLSSSRGILSKNLHTQKIIILSSFKVTIFIISILSIKKRVSWYFKRKSIENWRKAEEHRKVFKQFRYCHWQHKRKIASRLGSATILKGFSPCRKIHCDN